MLSYAQALQIVGHALKVAIADTNAFAIFGIGSKQQATAGIEDAWAGEDTAAAATTMAASRPCPMSISPMSRAGRLAARQRERRGATYGPSRC